MTAEKMYEILDAIDKRLTKQDRRIEALQAEIQRLYARLK
jgi:uncharacterized small protein (DUF1192 family)